VKLFAALVATLLIGALTVPERVWSDTAGDASTDSLPGESVYQLPMDLTDQNGRRVELATLRGQPVLVAMFYTSCDNVCPMIAIHLRRIERELTDAEQKRLRVLMVSFDPARDTTEALHAFAETHKADPARWVVARADENDVRDLAAALGIRYRELGDGVYNHSSTITLLDADGVIRARTSDLKNLDQDFIRTVEASLR
jgi:protein SCO1/2